MTEKTDEKVIFHEADIVITTRRVTVGSQTFLTADIRSVSVEKKTRYVWPIALVLFALIAVSGGLALLENGFFGWLAIITGAFMFAGAVFVFTIARPDYHLIIATDSGTINPASSLDEEFIRKLAESIEQARFQTGNRASHEA
jgi:hypothetical protein